MYITDQQIKEKIDEVLSFRYGAGLNYHLETDPKLKEDYTRMFNLITFKINNFLDDMDKILYPTIDCNEEV